MQIALFAVLISTLLFSQISHGYQCVDLFQETDFRVVEEDINGLLRRLGMNSEEALSILQEGFRERIEEMREAYSIVKQLHQEREILLKSRDDYVSEDAFQVYLDGNQKRMNQAESRLKNITMGMNIIASRLFLLRGIRYKIHIATGRLVLEPDSTTDWGRLARDYEERYGGYLFYNAQEKYSVSASHRAVNMQTSIPHMDIASGLPGLDMLHELDHAEVTKLIAEETSSFLSFRLRSTDGEYTGHLPRVRGVGYEKYFRGDELLAATHNLRDTTSFSSDRKRLGRLNASMLGEVRIALSVARRHRPDSFHMLGGEIDGLPGWKLISRDFMRNSVLYWSIPTRPGVELEVPASPELHAWLSLGIDEIINQQVQQAYDQLIHVLEQSERELEASARRIGQLHVSAEGSERVLAIEDLREYLSGSIDFQDPQLLDPTGIYERFQ